MRVMRSKVGGVSQCCRFDHSRSRERSNVTVSFPMFFNAAGLRSRSSSAIALLPRDLILRVLASFSEFLQLLLRSFQVCVQPSQCAVLFFGLGLVPLERLDASEHIVPAGGVGRREFGDDLVGVALVNERLPLSLEHPQIAVRLFDALTKRLQL